MAGVEGSEDKQESNTIKQTKTHMNEQKGTVDQPHINGNGEFL